MINFKHLLILLITANIAVSGGDFGKGVLLIHNLQFLEVTHSEMLHSLRGMFPKVDTFKTSEILASKAKLYSYKRPLYDLVILMTPLSGKSMAIVEKLELLKFYDEGNSILLIGDNRSVQSWRILLSQFGFDAVVATSNPNGDYAIRTNNFDSRVQISKNAIQFERLRANLKQGLIYEGGAISLTPYENVISWSLIEAPENSLFINNGIPEQIIDKNKMNILVGAQGATNQSRIAAIGSFKMFSNHFNNLSAGDNIRFFENLLGWLKFESQVLKIENMSLCSLENGNCPNPGYFSENEGFEIKFQIFDENHKFYEPKEGKIYLHMTKQVTFLNIEPSIIEENGQKYFYSKVDAHKSGLYKLTLIHNKPGYHINSKDNIKMVNIIADRIKTVEIFSLEGLPFLIIILVVMASALNLTRTILQSKEDN